MHITVHLRVQPLLEELPVGEAAAPATSTPITPRDQAVPGRSTAYDDTEKSDDAIQSDDEILQKKMARFF